MFKILICSILLSSSAMAQNFNNPQGYQLYRNGQYKGNINHNPYDTNSINNRMGQYGNPYNAKSVKNKFGGGNRYNLNTNNR